MLLLTLNNQTTVHQGYIEDEGVRLVEGRLLHHSEVTILGEVTGPAINWSSADLACGDSIFMNGEYRRRSPEDGDTIFIGGNKSRHYVCTLGTKWDGTCQITPVK